MMNQALIGIYQSEDGSGTRCFVRKASDPEEFDQVVRHFLARGVGQVAIWKADFVETRGDGQ